MSESTPTRGVPLHDLCRWMEQELDHANITDWPVALNGLQVENRGRVHRIGAAVDACEATLTMAAERGIDLLLVHHGLFWSGLQPIRGAAYRKLKIAFDADLAVFSSHLPLDLHPLWGNNACLATALGWENPTPFFHEKGRPIGLQVASPGIALDELASRLGAAVDGPVKVIPGGSGNCQRIGLVTGGAGGSLFKAVEEGVDTFITGEGPHWSYTAAEENGLNLLYAGHYATETFGVKALAAAISQRTGLPWEFLDHPTGL